MTDKAHLTSNKRPPGFLLPEQPNPPKPTTPMVYVDDKIEFEYKRLVYDIAEDGAPDENTLNRLGKEGWELVGIVGHNDNGYFYFKRVKR